MPCQSRTHSGCECSAVEEVVELLARGMEARHVGETKMNASSSRSHVIFACNVDCTTVVNSATTLQTSCLNLVDLAGKPRWGGDRGHLYLHLLLQCGY